MPLLTDYAARTRVDKRWAEEGPYHRGGAWLVFLHGSYMRLSAGTAQIAFTQVGAQRGGSSVG